MKTRLAGVTLVATMAAALVACSSDSITTIPNPTPTETPDGPTIVTVFLEVNWYPPCAISPIELGGNLYFPLPMGAPPVDESRYPIPVIVAEADVSSMGLATMMSLDLPRVVPPGPGDDIGTVIVYSDGMARFESRSGNVAWLTREVQEYGYVC